MRGSMLVRGGARREDGDYRWTASINGSYAKSFDSREAMAAYRIRAGHRRTSIPAGIPGDGLIQNAHDDC
jgi:hypothetical protein